MKAYSTIESVESLLRGELLPFTLLAYATSASVYLVTTVLPPFHTIPALGSDRRRGAYFTTRVGLEAFSSPTGKVMPGEEVATVNSKLSFFFHS